MQNFWLWFSTGLEHITDLGGYDHILFVTLLSIGYTFSSWKKLVVMITAFTLGHSISLALSVIGNLSINTALIEFLIALSIFITAVYHLRVKENSNAKWIYMIVVLFGLIHGTGFSYLLKAMLGKEEAIAGPLLYFNLGLEAGQLFIVLAVLSLNLAMSYVKAIPFRVYKIVVVSLIGVIALKMCVERITSL
ncbi:MAG: HupE/UreJ family protein [Sphingobacteriaceae bacterium]|nr:HupE/UreJ family protein [Sphingobacteriaceae bacterium]